MIHNLTRRGLLVALAIRTACGSVCPTAFAQASADDPLPSWNEGGIKRTILDFVGRVTRESGPDYVPPAERIATSDNDGTLWIEQPVYVQFQFAIDRAKALLPQKPELADKPPFKALLEGNREALAALGEKGMLEILALSHAGMTTDAFNNTVVDWLAQARDARFNRPYTSLAYQPMLELLGYLRRNGFKTFIVSGGGVEFMRVFADGTYGIPPEQVVGSSGVMKFQIESDGTPVLIKEAKVEFVDDGPGKPVGIQRFIGRRPIFAFGNSDGDLEMLQWTAGAPGARFMGLVHHTDAVREWAYDRQSHVGKLDKALDEAQAKGWTVVDMKRDWKRIFPPQDGGGSRALK